MRLALTLRTWRSLRRCGMPGACLRVKTCTWTTSTGAWPRGGVRPHHATEKDAKKTKKRQPRMVARPGPVGGALLFFFLSFRFFVGLGLKRLFQDLLNNFP